MSVRMNMESMPAIDDRHFKMIDEKKENNLINRIFNTLFGCCKDE